MIQIQIAKCFWLRFRSDFWFWLLLWCFWLQCKWQSGDCHRHATMVNGHHYWALLVWSGFWLSMSESKGKALKIVVWLVWWVLGTRCKTLSNGCDHWSLKLIKPNTQPWFIIYNYWMIELNWLNSWWTCLMFIVYYYLHSVWRSIESPLLGSISDSIELPSNITTRTTQADLLKSQHQQKLQEEDKNTSFVHLIG